MTSIGQSTRNTHRFPFLRRLTPVSKTLVAVGAYAIWTALTWLLEGRIQTFLRPDAVTDRLVYTGIANVLVGTVLALVLVREFVAAGFTTRTELGFRSLPRTVVEIGRAHV